MSRIRKLTDHATKNAKAIRDRVKAAVKTLGYMFYELGSGGAFLSFIHLTHAVEDLGLDGSEGPKTEITQDDMDRWFDSAKG